MPSSKPGQSSITIRCTPQEHEKAQQQADKLGLSLSDYIRLIINLDSATGIIKRLEADKLMNDMRNSLKESE